MQVEPGLVARGKGKFCSDSCYKATLRGKSKALSEAQIAEAVVRYADHASTPAIAADFRCDPTTVLLALRAAGVVIRLHTEKERPLRRQLPVDEIVRLYKEGHSTVSLAQRYGASATAIVTRLRREGVSLRGGRFGYGHFIRCTDGHVVRSHAERVVDDWLYAHHIAHAYEPPLPFGRNMTADFLARGCYIEVWGVKNHSHYEARRVLKLAAYAKANLPIVSLDAGDIDAGMDPGTVLGLIEGLAAESHTDVPT